MFYTLIGAGELDFNVNGKCKKFMDKNNNNDIFTIKNITTIKDLCILVDSPLQMHKKYFGNYLLHKKKLNSDQNK